MIKRTSLFRALVLFLPLVAIAARAEEQIQAPDFKEGDYWRYKVITKIRAGASPANESWNGIYIMRYAKGRIVLRKLVDGKAIPSPGDSPATFLGFRQHPREHTLQFPLYLGKQWRYSYQLKATHNVNVEVVSEERVATEAGIFNALKIERTRQIAYASQVWGTGIWASRGAYFYSPETKSIVKYDTEDDSGGALHIELLKFEVSR